MKNLHYSGIIAAIHKESIAEEIELEIGDKILEINGERLRDIIDLSFAMAEEEIELLVEKRDGAQELIAFDKEYDEELGVEFESAVFDGIRRCGNKCWFCFVDQIAPHMRPSLSVKDDDYRMSFLYGNFVTLTNMRKEDFARIQRLHLSPLFVSVHATDGALRAEMLSSKRAADIMDQLKRLEAMDVEFHTQVVLCPDINDGPVLEQTIEDLAAMRPLALSLAIVPVGLTRYRENCHPLRKLTGEEAAAVIDQVECWQEKFRRETGESFVYLGDEFYFLANRELPPHAFYDGFPQLENGVGITRDFLTAWETCDDGGNAYAEPMHLDIVCGKSAAKVLRPLLESLRVANLTARVVEVENHFFGVDITVTGLLIGKDILAALRNVGGPRSGIIVPGVALRSGEEVFLDDMTLSEIKLALGVPVKTAYNGAQLKSLLCNWHDAPEPLPDETAHTWQSNCGYCKNKE